MKINMRKVMRGLYITLILGIVAGGAISCEPEPCLDCWSYYVDGVETEVCYEIDCDLIYY